MFRALQMLDSARNLILKPSLHRFLQCSQCEARRASSCECSSGTTLLSDVPITLDVTHSTESVLILESAICVHHCLWLVAAIVLGRRGCQFPVACESVILVLTNRSLHPHCALHQLVACRN